MHLDQFLLALLILLVVSALSVAFFKSLGLGSILGLLVAGVVLGPSGLGLARRVAELREFSELGIVFLLAIIGLEMHPRRLWALRRAVFGLGSAQVVLTGAALALYVVLTGGGWNQSLLLGLGLALSSTAFAMQLLGERAELDTEHGRAAFGILLFQDLSIVPLLALVPLLAEQETPAAHGSILHRLVIVGATLGALYVFGRYVVPAALDRLAKERNHEGFALVAMAAIIAATWAMSYIGLSMALGAFTMGVLLSGSPHRHEIEAVIAPFKGMLVGLFFIAVGMEIDFRLLPEVGPLLVLHLIALLAIKAAVLFGLCLLFGVSRPAAARVALLLPQGGEFGFVLFGAARTAGLLSPEGFAFAALLISMSMAATPLLAKLAPGPRAATAAG